jgi:hypothetical protein
MKRRDVGALDWLPAKAFQNSIDGGQGSLGRGRDLDSYRATASAVVDQQA